MSARGNLKLLLRDIREDWEDTLSIRQFIRWQRLKVSDGFRFGLWPWGQS